MAVTGGDGDGRPLRTTRIDHTMVARSVLGLLAGRMATMGMTLAMTPLIIDRLGVTLFGVWAVIGASLSFVAQADLGLGQALTRYATVMMSRGDIVGLGRVVALSLVGYGLMTALTSPVVWLAAPRISLLLHVPAAERSMVSVSLVLMVVLAFGGTGLNSYSLVPAGYGRLELVGAVNTAARLLTSITALVLLLRHWSLDALVVGSAVGTAFSVLASWVAAHWLVPTLRLTLRGMTRPLLREILVYGSSVQVTAASGLVNNEFDRYVIGSVAGAASVAPYEVANRLANLVRLVPGMIFASLLPYFTQAHTDGDDKRIGQIYERGTAWITAGVIAGTGFLCVAGGQLVRAWIGSGLGPARWLVAGLTVAYGVNQLTGVGTAAVRAIGLPGYESRYGVLGLALNVALTIGFIPIFGAYGTVIATIVATIISSAYFFVVFHRLRAYSPGAVVRPFVKSAGAALFASVAVMPLLATVSTSAGRLHRLEVVGGAAVVYTVLYVAVLGVLRFWTAGEVVWLRRAMRSWLIRPQLPDTPTRGQATRNHRRGEPVEPDIRPTSAPSVLVAVVIVNWNCEELTSEALTSLDAQDFSNLFRIVVDNASGNQDDALRLIASRHPGVTTIANSQNLGFAEGSNVGIRTALAGQADYIVLLNSDVSLAPAAISEMVAAMERDATLGAVSPAIYYASEPSRTWFAGGSIVQGARVAARHDGVGEELARADRVEPFWTEWLPGTAILVRRSAIERVGMLDAAYFLYWEDVDWCLRMRRKGFQLAVVPAARAWHLVNASTGKVPHATVYYWERNRLRFIDRWGRLDSRLLALGKILWRLAAWRIRPPAGDFTSDIKLAAYRDYILRRFGQREVTR